MPSIVITVAKSAVIVGGAVHKHKQLLHTIACTIISNENFHGMLKPTQVSMASPNFMEKIIAGGFKTAKFVNASKVFHYTVTVQ